MIYNEWLHRCTHSLYTRLSHMQDEYQWGYERLVAGCRKCNISEKGVLFFFDMLKEKLQPAQEMEIKTFTLSKPTDSSHTSTPSSIVKALRFMPLNINALLISKEEFKQKSNMCAAVATRTSVVILFIYAHTHQLCCTQNMHIPCSCESVVPSFTTKRQSKL